MTEELEIRNRLYCNVLCVDVYLLPIKAHYIGEETMALYIDIWDSSKASSFTSFTENVFVVFYSLKFVFYTEEQ